MPRSPAVSSRLPLLFVLVLLPLGLLSLVAVTGAQVREQRGVIAQREMVPKNRGSFMFCRLIYTSVRREPDGLGWSTDYPNADRNLMVRLEEFTTTSVNRYDTGDPAHALVRATDPDLFGCPFLFASDVGTAGFTAEEREKLREYLLKGGFLWVDDFWGRQAMSHWLREMRQILPEADPVRIRAGHPLFSTYYTIEEIPQISHLQFWLGSGGLTSERGPESAEATMTALADPSGRVVVLMTHNTDIADGWEREADDYSFFALFSPRAYAVGINVALYAMTR
jgi:hypothetical protein